MKNNQDEFSQARDALFEVRNTIAALEKTFVPIRGKPETSNNFQKYMLEEIDQSIKKLSVLREQMANI